MGVVKDLLQDIQIPQFYKVYNHMDETHIEDVAQAVRDALKREGTLDRIKPGTTVCFPGASREIANIVVILRTIAEEIKRVGGIFYGLKKELIRENPKAVPPTYAEAHAEAPTCGCNRCCA